MFPASSVYQRTQLNSYDSFFFLKAGNQLDNIFVVDRRNLNHEKNGVGLNRVEENWLCFRLDGGGPLKHNASNARTLARRLI